MFTERNSERKRKNIKSSGKNQKLSIKFYSLLTPCARADFYASARFNAE